MPQTDDVMSLLYWSIGGFTGLMVDGSGVVNADAALAYENWRAASTVYNNKTHVSNNTNATVTRHFFQTEIITDLAPLCTDNFLLLIVNGDVVKGCTSSADISVKPVYASEFGLCTRFTFSNNINITMPGMYAYMNCIQHNRHKYTQEKQVQ